MKIFKRIFTVVVSLTLALLFSLAPGFCQDNEWDDCNDNVYFVKTESGKGSCFVVGQTENSTYFLTAYHVVGDIQTKHDNEVILLFKRNSIVPTNITEKDLLNNGIVAHIEKSEPKLDIALLKTEKIDGVKRFEVGSKEDIKITNTVVNIGYPIIAKDGSKKLEPSIHQGNIAKEDAGDTIGKVYFEFDSEVNHGDSGGPVILKSSKKVIGITSAGLETNGVSTGMNYAVRVDNFADWVNFPEEGNCPVIDGDDTEVSDDSDSDSASSSSNKSTAAKPVSQNGNQNTVLYVLLGVMCLLMGVMVFAMLLKKGPSIK